MLRRVRVAPGVRAVAVLLVIAFSGAPRIAVGIAGSAHGEHRCTCPARGSNHACDCPICKAASGAAARDHDASAVEDDAKVPPCHRKVAASKKAPPRLPACVSCVQGACGDPQGPRAITTGLEPFTLPPLDDPPTPEAGRAVPLPRSAPVSRALPPDVPPPKA